ncbi:Cloroperoxidase [Melanomma pulvis-pyrius CBS 109.77]|uniref:Cloroperoxidase n=1 Tax=Melanomma pulvis-pyrius CBS 109.77 TaxID=1314802 RepID=A0A6A6XS30_9PLEO|nr:Cloroperoxidase [Melanomma pulvis-pyrius CBS 109.77]
MKSSILCTTLLSAAVVSANPHFRRQGSLDTWAPGGPDDFRGPCPMMNTLANHGFLPHDGRNITLENAVHALNTALNFNTSVATIMWEQAVIANPEPNATFFTLDHLNRHNVLEHDASLSRSDAFFGNNHVFNQSIFDTSKAFWTQEILTPQHFADSKIFRQVASRSANPNYTFTAHVEPFSLGEMAAPFLMFGDIEKATVNRSLVTFFFENEKLPVELGWKKQANAINLEDVIRMSEVIANATNLQTTATPVVVDKRALHGGFSFQH